jgi:C1A family cysteine protease
MTIVGYQIDNRFAGGGYFILRNSWGRAWGANGYGYLPFAWCKRYECSAYALDDVTWDDTGRFINLVTGAGAS